MVPLLDEKQIVVNLKPSNKCIVDYLNTGQEDEKKKKIHKHSTAQG